MMVIIPGEKRNAWWYLTNGSDSRWRTQFGNLVNRDPDKQFVTKSGWRKNVSSRDGRSRSFHPLHVFKFMLSGPTGNGFITRYCSRNQNGKDSFLCVWICWKSCQVRNSCVQLLRIREQVFELTQTEQILSGVLSTGLDFFGPVWSTLFSWLIDGWGNKN